MKNAFIKKEWLFWLILLIPFMYAAYVWNDLPERMPTHWGINGEPNGYGSKTFGGLFLPFLNVALYFFMRIVPKIDPRKRNYADFQSAFTNIRFGLTLFMTLLYFFVVQAALGNNLFISKGIEILVLLLFAFLGNYLRTVRPNWFIGIRTPWTMESPEVWKRTHELGGKLFFYTGILGIILVLLCSASYAWITFVLIIASTFVTIIYSFVLFQKLEKKETQI
jgi:uncharacterized membrane protein